MARLDRSAMLMVMLGRSPRIRSGTFFRFDSASELVGFCRQRYPMAYVRTSNVDDEFLLQVTGPTGAFESLIVHFEGERAYAVMLP